MKPAKEDDIEQNRPLPPPYVHTRFLVRVYALLFCQLAATTGCVASVYAFPDVSQWVRGNPSVPLWSGILCLPLVCLLPFDRLDAEAFSSY